MIGVTNRVQNLKIERRVNPDEVRAQNFHFNSDKNSPYVKADARMETIYKNYGFDGFRYKRSDGLLGYIDPKRPVLKGFFKGKKDRPASIRYIDNDTLEIKIENQNSTRAADVFKVDFSNSFGFFKSGEAINDNYFREALKQGKLDVAA